MSYILEVQEDENGDQYITFPDEVVEELGWQEGDVLNWDVRGTGIIITKVNDAAGYEVIEEQNSPNSRKYLEWKGIFRNRVVFTAPKLAIALE